MMAVAAPPVGVTGFTQPMGVIRSLTDEFLRLRAATSRSRDHPEASDSEDVRWVSERVSVRKNGRNRRLEHF